jgi:hypothetical protein
MSHSTAYKKRAVDSSSIASQKEGSTAGSNDHSYACVVGATYADAALAAARPILIL